MKTPLSKQHILTGLPGLLTVILCWISAAVWAQPQYTSNFPTATSASNIPFQNTTNNKVQWLYKPSDFGAAPAGFINKIYFRNQFSMLPVICSFTDFQVKMGESTLSSLPPGPWITAGMNTVFQANTFNVWPITGDWMPVVLQTPFYYDNTKNFIVEASQGGYSVGFNVMQGGLTGRSLYGSLGSIVANPQNYLCEFGFDITMGSTDVSIESVNLTDSFCAGMTSVSVVIKNNGPSTLTSLSLYWKVGAAIQPILNWAGNLASGLTTTVPLGSYNFLPSTQYLFTAWCSNPNNLPDNNASNDTLNKSNIWVKPVPTAIPQSLVYSVCLGDSVHIPITFTGTQPWSIGYMFNGQTYSSQIQSPVFTLSLYPPTATSYSVFFNLVKDATGCNAINLPAVNVQVKPVPTVFLGPDQVVKASGYIQLDAGAGFTTYLWSTGATTQSINIPANTFGSGPHDFWVRVTNAGGCAASDTVMVDIIDDIGIAPASNQVSEIRIIPNPSSGRLEVILPDALHQQAQITLINRDGKEVYAETRSLHNTDHTINLDFRHFSNGVYLIRIVTIRGEYKASILILNH
ncbi:MAG TPA: T9SS type A sorting domain-containing protein [Bacteroidales bacterium]|nr:T9SS type A sorting domain-containing protein [Bacteroidales bacterium]